MVFQDYALYPQMTRRTQPRLRAADAQGAARPRSTRRVTEAAGAARARAAARAQAAAALRRPAAARGARPRARARPAGVPDGRAALEPRREAARRDARRDQGAAARDRHHDRLRHPRPGRGDDDGRPDRRHARRACSSRSATRTTVYERPANMFVAGFIGSPAMTFGRFAAERGGRLAAADGRCDRAHPGASAPDVPSEVDRRRPAGARAAVERGRRAARAVLGDGRVDRGARPRDLRRRASAATSWSSSSASTAPRRTSWASCSSSASSLTGRCYSIPRARRRSAVRAAPAERPAGRWPSAPPPRAPRP